MNHSHIIPPFILIVYLLSIYAIPVRQHSTYAPTYLNPN